MQEYQAQMQVLSRSIDRDFCTAAFVL